MDVINESIKSSDSNNDFSFDLKSFSSLRIQKKSEIKKDKTCGFLNLLKSAEIKEMKKTFSSKLNFLNSNIVLSCKDDGKSK